MSVFQALLKGGNRAPGPKGSFIWGTLQDFSADSIGFLRRSVEQHGDIVRFRFGPIIAHLVNRPEYIEQVLLRGAKEYDKKTRSVNQIRPTCGDSLLSDNEDAWLRHRRLIQPFFGARYIQSTISVIDEIMAVTMDDWTKIAKTGGTIDIVSEMMRLVIAISAKSFFNGNVDAVRIENALAIILNDTWRRLQAPVDPSMLSQKFHRPSFRKAVGEIDEIIYRLIAQRRSNPGEQDDLLAHLLRAHEAENDLKLSDKELRDAAVTLLLAGHETTANALAWGFYLVAKSPEKNFEAGDINNIFAETLRLYPSIWISERRVKTHSRIGGYDIPKGSLILICPYVLHRHPAYWNNPDAFDPNRFDSSQIASRPKSSYLPFGLGHHRCVGMHMATHVGTRVMHNIFERFHLHIVQQEDAGMLPGITLRHADALPLRVSLKQ